jgi:hypothetical protein
MGAFIFDVNGTVCASELNFPTKKDATRAKSRGIFQHRRFKPAKWRAVPTTCGLPIHSHGPRGLPAQSPRCPLAGCAAQPRALAARPLVRPRHGHRVDLGFGRIRIVYKNANGLGPQLHDCDVSSPKINLRILTQQMCIVIDGSSDRPRPGPGAVCIVH